MLADKLMRLIIGLEGNYDFLKQFSRFKFDVVLPVLRRVSGSNLKYLSVPLMKKLDYSFYNRPDPVVIARELLGKILVTEFRGLKTSGRIVETEAYAGEPDRASHAFGGRRTRRTEVMYRKGGTAYIYLCYGIHHLFNIVTNRKDIPHAILIRALEPLSGIETMLRRAGKKKLDFSLTRGPGNLARALGISTSHSGLSLVKSQIYLADDGFLLAPEQVVIGPRIGVEYAAEDAFLPYRFFVLESDYVSGKKTGKEKVLPARI
jgi:DNA-3-methyladenine glycosylase